MHATTARDLYESIGRGATPRLLDVRNEEEFARWKVEGPGRIDALNRPYFAFIEAEEESVAAVTRWLDGKPGPLHVVCAKGGSSEYVAELLRGRGIDARNVEGGMVAWGAATVARDVEAAGVAGVRVWQIHRFGKGCLSYVIASKKDAVVVDPHHDAGEYRSFLDERGLEARAVFDTHLHADHVSGAPAFSRGSGAEYHACAADFAGASFSYLPIEDRRPLRFGGTTVTPLTFLSAPGHTPGSTALLVGDALLLTGDTLFVGSVGRPDLAGKTAEWGRELYATLHRRLAGVPDDARVLPAHTAGPREVAADGVVGARLGDLRAANPALRADEPAFLAMTAAGERPAPAAYAVIRTLNLGLRAVGEEERVTMELGKNECALGREGPGAAR